MNKEDNSYKTISEVVKILNLKSKKGDSLPTHTLRFWEKEFKQIKPKILTGNRRYEMADNSIRADNLKNKLNKISNIVKSLNKLK